MATVTATAAAPLRLSLADLDRSLTASGTALSSSSATQIVITVPSSFALDGQAGAQIRLDGSFTGTTLATLTGTITGYADLAAGGQTVWSLSGLGQSVRTVLDGGFTRGTLLAGSDSFTGGAGSDRVAGLGGNDQFDGGAGVDIFTVRGARRDYSIVAFDNPLTLGDAVQDRDGDDILFNTEIVLFDADKSVIALLVAAEATVARLYSAAFGRLPDADGLAFWLDRFRDGVGTFAIADGFTRSAEFAGIYAGSSTAQFVDRLYQNVLGRSGEAGGVAYWNGILNSGQDGRTGVLISFAGSAENVQRTEPWLFEI